VKVLTEHVACVCAEVDDCIRGAGDVGALVACEVEVRCEGIEDLAAVCEVGFESEDTSTWVWEVYQVEVQDLIATLDELWDDVAACFA